MAKNRDRKEKRDAKRDAKRTATEDARSGADAKRKDESPTRPTFEIEPLEPRVLLSATWVDTDAPPVDDAPDAGDAMDAVASEVAPDPIADDGGGGDSLFSDGGDGGFFDELAELPAEGGVSDGETDIVDSVSIDDSGEGETSPSDAADDTAGSDVGDDTASDAPAEDASEPTGEVSEDDVGDDVAPAAVDDVDEAVADDVDAAADDTVDMATAVTGEEEGSEDSSVDGEVQATADVDQTDATDNIEGVADGEVDDEAVDQDVALIDEVASEEPAPLNIVLVDSTLVDTGTLTSAIEDGAIAVEYDGANESMVDVLSRVEAMSTAQGSQIASLSILSHGEGGQFDLGNEVVSDEMTDAQRAAWQSLSDNFTADANIYAYGCNVVDGSGEGQDLLNQLSQLTGTEVFGSNDTTGAGGDWELEAVSSGGEAELAAGFDDQIDETEAAAYEGTLDVTVNESDGLIGHWELDGDATDATDADNDGTFQNPDGDEWVSGHNGSGAASFDGIDDFIQTDSGDVAEVTGDYTTSVWIKPDATQNDWAGIYSATDASGATNHWNLQFDNSGDRNIVVYHNGNNRWDTGIDLADVADDDWHNIQITRDGTTMSAFLDGNLVGSGTFSHDPLGSADHMNIGAERTSSTDYVYAGEIDELRVYDHVLAADELSTLSSEPTNDTPDAIDDTVSTNEDTAVTTGNVLTNDTDGDGDTLSITGFTQGTNGTVADNSDGTFTYTPDANFNGSDSFTYTVDDGNGGTDTATVDVTVGAVDDAPTAEAGASQTVDEGDSVTLDATGSSDAEGQSLTYTWTQTDGPTVSLDDASASQPEFTAPDVAEATTLTFQVEVSDGTTTALDEVQVTVEPTNQPSMDYFDELNGGAGFDTFADMTTAYQQYVDGADGVITVNDLAEGEDLGEQYRDEHGVWFSGTAGGAYGSSSGARAEDGSIAETITGYDGSYMSDGDDVYVKFSNDDPNNPFTIHFDTPVSSVGAFVGMGVQGSDHSLTVRAYDANDNLIAERVVETQLWEADANKQNYESFFAIESDQAAITKVEILNASNVEFANALLIDNVTWSEAGFVNDAPDAVDDSVSTSEDTAVTTGNVLTNDTDPEGDTLSITGFTQGSNGAVANNGDGTFTYTPDANFSGSDSFTYTVDDGNGGTDTATVDVTVSAAPGEPDVSTGLVGHWAFDEASGSAADDSVGSLDGALTNMSGSEWTPGQEGGGLTFDGVDDYVHLDTDMSPTLGGTATVSTWIRTTQTGAPQSYYSPSVIGSEQSGGENDIRWGFIDDQGRIGVGAYNDTGARSAEAINDGQWHHVAFTRDADTGETAVFVDGQLSSTFAGRAGLITSPIQDIGRTFDFNDADPETAYLQGTLDDIRVYDRVLDANDIAQLASTNEPPDAVDDSVSTSEGTAVTTGNVLSNDTDGEGDTLSITGFTQGSSGAVADNGDGTFTYTPDANFSGSDSFTYTADDGNGGTDTGTVNVTVNADSTPAAPAPSTPPSNTSPDATDDAVVTDEAMAVTTGNVLSNDTDGDGDALSISGFTQGNHGTVANNSDGTFTYTPDADFTGSDSFTYTVDDGNGGTDTATVNVTVSAAKDATIAEKSGQTHDENQPVDEIADASGPVDSLGDGLPLVADGDDAVGGTGSESLITPESTTAPQSPVQSGSSSSGGTADGSLESTSSSNASNVHPFSEQPGPTMGASTMGDVSTGVLSDSGVTDTPTPSEDDDALSEATDDLEILDPHEDFAGSVESGAVVEMQPTSGHIDLFSVVGGPNYPSIEGQDDLVAGFEAVSDISGTDIDSSDMGGFSLSQETLEQGFEEALQPVETDEELVVAALPSMPDWAFESSGRVGVEAGGSSLAQGPVLTDADADRDDESSDKSRAPSRAGLFGLLWGLIRGSGRTSDSTSNNRLPDDKQNKTRR